MRRFAVLAFSLLVTLLAACSHYRLGTGVERDFETLFVAPVATEGLAPQATAVLTTQIREAFIRDGRLKIVNTPDEADAVLSVTLGSYDRARLTSTPDDSGLARKMNIELLTTATLRDPDGDKTWFADQPVRVDRQIFTDDGSTDTSATDFLRPVQQTQAEYQLLPQLGEALGAQLKNLVLDTW